MAWKGVFRSALVAGFSLGAGDGLMQAVEMRRGQIQEWNPWRTARFAIVGFTLHGPFFHTGFGRIERLFGNSRSVTNAMAKTLTSQVTLFPMYISLLFPYISLLEGKNVDQALAKTKQVWWPTFTSGAVFWPVVNLVNFIVVPPGTPRILCLAVAGVAWNSYLSSVNFEANRHPQDA